MRFLFNEKIRSTLNSLYLEKMKGKVTVFAYYFSHKMNKLLWNRVLRMVLYIVFKS